MALLTLVSVGSSGELCLVFVFVTRHAAVELQLVNRLFALGNVASRAFYLRVLGFEGISGSSVIFYRVLRRFKSLQCVAGGAISFIGALDKLSLVLVLMAIQALAKGDLLLKVTLEMAGHAFYLLMLSLQWILRFGVVERLV